MPSMLVKQLLKKEIPGLGNRIKDARLSSQKSMTELCREVGFSRTYWTSIESECIPGGLPIETLHKIESALGVDFGVVIEQSLTAIAHLLIKDLANETQGQWEARQKFSNQKTEAWSNFVRLEDEINVINSQIAAIAHP